MLSVLPASSSLDVALSYDGKYATILLPYSAILNGIGGLLALVLSLCALNRIYKKQDTTSENTQQYPLTHHQEL